MHSHRPNSVAVCSVVKEFEQYNDYSGGGHWNKADPAHTHLFHVFNSSRQTLTPTSKCNTVEEAGCVTRLL